MQELEHWCVQRNIKVPTEFFHQMIVLKELLYKWNTLHNLTRVPQQDFVVRHVIDSLILLEKVPSFMQHRKVIDLGTGAGFPGVPLAAALPDAEFCLLDSSEKRILFIEQACAKMSIKNVYPVHARIEEFIKDLNQVANYDAVVSRALAPLKKLLPLAMPFCAETGKMYFLKSESLHDELQDDSSETFMRQHGLSYQVLPYTLPARDQQRCIMQVQASGSGTQS